LHLYTSFTGVRVDFPDICNLGRSLWRLLLLRDPTYHWLGRKGLLRRSICQGGGSGLFSLSEHFFKQVEVLPRVHKVRVALHWQVVWPQRVAFQFRKLLLVGQGWDREELKLTFFEKGLQVIVLDDLPYSRQDRSEEVLVHFKHD